MRCLVVDDCEELALLWRLELTTRGFDVDVALNAEEAFKAMPHTRYDLIVADLGLPDGSGVTVAQSAAMRAPDADVVVVTARTEFPNGELFGMSENIVGVFRKSADMTDLYAFVEHLRERRERDVAPAARAARDRGEAEAAGADIFGAAWSKARRITANAAE